MDLPLRETWLGKLIIHFPSLPLADTNPLNIACWDSVAFPWFPSSPSGALTSSSSSDKLEYEKLFVIVSLPYLDFPFLKLCFLSRVVIEGTLFAELSHMFCTTREIASIHFSQLDLQSVLKRCTPFLARSLNLQVPSRLRCLQSDIDCRSFALISCDDVVFLPKTWHVALSVNVMTPTIFRSFSLINTRLFSRNSTQYSFHVFFFIFFQSICPWNKPTSSAFTMLARSGYNTPGIRVLISTFSLFNEDVVRIPRPGEEISRNTNFSSLRMNLALLEREFVANVIINVLCCVSSQLSVTKLEHGSPQGVLQYVLPIRNLF